MIEDCMVEAYLLGLIPAATDDCLAIEHGGGYFGAKIRKKSKKVAIALRKVAFFGTYRSAIAMFCGLLEETRAEVFIPEGEFFVHFGKNC